MAMITTIDSGRWKNTIGLPCPMAMALRRLASASGPRIMPTTTGAVGKSKRRITTPKRPMPNSRNRSKVFWRMPYAPTVAKIRMPAYSCGFGILSSLTHRPTIGRLSTSSIRLPMYSEAISAQTSAAEVVNSCGPGWMP
ncbi:hypothetical protein D3C72_1874710 [compost metagenome]